ncbi:MAG TPA: hypothetical protein GX515_06125 [Firmicutes bacterium]|nr:hypothetical protein [Bacillota bacterium]
MMKMDADPRSMNATVKINVKVNLRGAVRAAQRFARCPSSSLPGRG